MNLFKTSGGLVIASTLLFAQADNTEKNKMDKMNKMGQKKTADSQSNSASDLEMTRVIRKMLTDDETLSTYAKNVKVITKMGKVTLRGPINTAEEKKAVMGHAVMTAGAANVTDETELMKTKKDK